MRSRDSRNDGKRFMMRLDKPTREKLEGLPMQFDKSIAEIIRQLVAQAKLEDFPQGWPLGVRERRLRQDRSSR
jgi:hypothetical protein